MKVFINGKEHEVAPGTKLAALVALCEESLRDEPMVRSLKARTGKSHLVFVHNGRVVPPDQYEAVEVKDRDEVMMIHPFFGG